MSGDRAGGIAGNEILTSATALVLTALLITEGVTILWLGDLRTEHMFVGIVLIPPVLLKLGSTGYRFLRYYTRNPAYLHKGPPHLLMRLLAPGVVIASLALFATGVLLLIEGPGSGSLKLLHKASFIVWFGAAGLHVLGHVLKLPSLLRTRAPGIGLRVSLVAVTIVAGAFVATATLPAADRLQDRATAQIGLDAA